MTEPRYKPGDRLISLDEEYILVIQEIFDESYIYYYEKAPDHLLGDVERLVEIYHFDRNQFFKLVKVSGVTTVPRRPRREIEL